MGGGYKNTKTYKNLATVGEANASPANLSSVDHGRIWTAVVLAGRDPEIPGS